MRVGLFFFAAFVFCAFGGVAGAEPSSRPEKLDAVLRHLGVPEERSFQADLRHLEGAQTRAHFESILKYIDPNGNLGRYATWNDHFLTLFLDRDEKQKPDFLITFKSSGTLPRDPSNLVYELWFASIINPTSLPLKGLRVAIDPGHMGSLFWDKQTGKYVHVRDGRHVSEGRMALHVGLLLAKQLRALGAEVILTRYDYEAVSKLDYETYDLTPFALNEIRASTDKKWFDELLESAPIGERLFQNATRHPEIKKLQSESRRGEYFIKRADLSARAEIINAFKPHMTLVIHFDAPGGPQPNPPKKTRDGWRISNLQKNINVIRTYVPGNIFEDELASREYRASVLRTLLDGQRWEESVMFSSSLVQAVSERAGIAVKKTPTDIGAIRVVDGVYARNLALNRLITHGAISYLEICYYDYVAEYKRLSVNDKYDEIDGVKFNYSSRLDDIVDGLKNGILNYVSESSGSTPRASISGTRL